MKKISCLVLLVLIIFVFSSCAKQETNDPTPEITNSQKQTINFSEIVPSKESGAEIKSMGEASMSTPYKNDEEKYNAAEYVIRGKVLSTEYVLDGSTVYTSSNVIIEESFKGDLSVGTTILVKELGGFVPSNIYSAAINMEKFGTSSALSESLNSDSSKILDMRINGAKVMEKDEEVILFLVTAPQSSLSKFEATHYDTLRLWQGKLLYNETYDVYAPYVPSDESDIVEATSYTEFSFKSFIDTVAE